MRSERASFLIQIVLALIVALNFLGHLNPELLNSFCEVTQERDGIYTGP